jgi:hypothetical protein
MESQGEGFVGHAHVMPENPSSMVAGCDTRPAGGGATERPWSMHPGFALMLPEEKFLGQRFCRFFLLTVDKDGASDRARTGDIQIHNLAL